MEFHGVTEDGRPPAALMVDWSRDIGDDSRFDRKWNAQGALGGEAGLTRAQVQAIASKQPVKE